jgi:uncharacterized membrane protein
LDRCRVELFFQYAVLRQHYAAISAVAFGARIVSGIAEIGLGILLLFQRWSVLAGWGLIALLVAVFRANIHMALHPEVYTYASPFSLWLRLGLQGMLIAWAYWYTRPFFVKR